MAAALTLLAAVPTAFAQLPTHLPPVTPAPLATAPPAAPALPDPIYWKQHLFLIPYQWGSAAQSSAAVSVTLYVSKDRGSSWQRISEARPDVKAFNYRAEGDGEYWFAVRTLDNRGRTWPEGPYQPELRVVVDTTMPRIDALVARPGESGAIDIECRATDVNLDSNSLAVEAQTDASATFQPVAVQVVPAAQMGLVQARSQPLPSWPLAIRARISDRAGNSAVYQTPFSATPSAPGPLLAQPAPIAAPGAAATTAPTASPTAPQSSPLTGQPWPAGAIARAPFRLWTGGMATTDDNLTSYGNPPVSSVPTITPVRPDVPAAGALSSVSGNSRVPAQYAGVAKPVENAPTPGWVSGAPGPRFSTLEPHRETTAGTSPSAAPPAAAAITPVDAPPPAPRPSSPPKLVGSRTFALEYDLDSADHGVSRVELWGTRDGGQVWNRYAIDDDNRSPLVATVDAEGLYGFKILVQDAGAAPAAPRAGEEPELWVAVDLQRPIIELSAIERGQGNLADHLVIRWRADDNNLEARPISLYFSSRPGGPWSAIATNLENSGHYAWRVERYIPSRIYLRAEARDTAGNLAAFQTRDPVELASQQPTARLRATPSQGR